MATTRTTDSDAQRPSREGDGRLAAIQAEDRADATSCAQPRATGDAVDTSLRLVSTDGSERWFRAQARTTDDDSDGDAVDVLQSVARRVEATIRSTDLAGRLGGDEIGVFCPRIGSSAEIVALAERIGEALAAPFSVGDQVVIVDASIGIAFSGVTTQAAGELVDAADRAMYVAKAAGGGRWAFIGCEQPVGHADPAADPVSVALRADVVHLEEQTVLAWQHSVHQRDSERAARLAGVCEALRTARLLLRLPADVGGVTTDVDVVTTDVDVVTTDVATADGHRTDRLHSVLDGTVAIAQATGMISRRSGADAVDAASMLHVYAASHGVALASAARLVVERDIEIDVVARPDPQPSADRPVGVAPGRASNRPVGSRRSGLVHDIYGQHSAAVYGCARFICGNAATRVTEEAFITFWQQHDPAEPNFALDRVRLVTIAHRLATHAARAAARDVDEPGTAQLGPPSAAVGAALSRSQVIERTLACAQLSAVERSVAALVIYGRCSSKEIARVLDESEPDVDRAIRSALRHVRTVLAVSG